MHVPWLDTISESQRLIEYVSSQNFLSLGRLDKTIYIIIIYNNAQFNGKSTSKKNVPKVRSKPSFKALKNLIYFDFK